MIGGEHSLKFSAPHLFRFGINSVLKILNKRMTDLINELMNYECICKTAPFSPGLLIIRYSKFYNKNLSVLIKLWVWNLRVWFGLDKLKFLILDTSDDQNDFLTQR